jgi:hypothetical protein
MAIMAGAPPDAPAARVDPNTVDSPWAGVGSLLVHGGVFSAAVIGPRHVLTAGHVAGDPAQVRFQLNAGPIPQVFEAQAVHRHPGFAGYDPKAPRDDLAVIVLARELPRSTPIYPLHRRTVRTETVIAMVGYGASGTGDAGATLGGEAGVKRVGYNVIDAVSTDAQGRQLVFVIDFDGGVAPNRSGGGTLGNQLESSFAAGDSGGPSFVCEAGWGLRCEGGRWALVGINTFVAAAGVPPSPAGSFGTIGGGMLVPGYAGWIDEVLAAVLPPPDNTAGGAQPTDRGRVAPAGLD